MASFAKYMKSKAGDFKIHTPGSRKEHDGKTEDSTLVHKALVGYYSEHNMQIPDWLHTKRAPLSHSRESSTSFFSSSSRSSATPVAPVAPAEQPQRQPVQQNIHFHQNDATLPAQQRRSNANGHTSTQSMEDMRRMRHSSGGPAAGNISSSNSTISSPFKPVARANTNTGVPQYTGEVSRSGTKTRRRFG